MAGRWFGRVRRSPQETAAATAARDGAVAAFLDLDTRQRFVDAAIRAVVELDPRSPLAREWERVEQQCFTATAEYVSVSERYDLDRTTVPAGGAPVDLFGATTAYQQVHTRLADAATAVDRFHQRHRGELDQARSAVAATPRIAEEAASAAATARRTLDAAGAFAGFRSVRQAGSELTAAIADLDAALAAASAQRVRAAATRVHGAAAEIDTALAAARTAGDRATTTLTSVRTRIDTVQSRLDRLPPVRSALLREFSEPNSADLIGNVDLAVRELGAGRAQWEAAGVAVREGRPEDAMDLSATAREHLTAAADACDALTDRLAQLRAVRDDPSTVERETRFRIRDAQRLVVDRDKVAQWGSVLDAQSRRVDVARERLTGAHPNFWAYLGELASVTAFVRTVVERVRGEVEQGR
ncbi:hypothetical protein [Nakamurella deserti]|uniref:hypothetical protein n=1 Tax=Nakamurella deserti TaxID=2164074 RepID=UPI000DBE496F|nr:hypothetical protein [Nakamurella deserti]